MIQAHLGQAQVLGAAPTLRDLAATLDQMLSCLLSSITARLREKLSDVAWSSASGPSASADRP